jgi:hypothetical protein
MSEYSELVDPGSGAGADRAQVGRSFFQEGTSGSIPVDDVIDTKEIQILAYSAAQARLLNYRLAIYMQDKITRHALKPDTPTRTGHSDIISRHSADRTVPQLYFWQLSFNRPVRPWKQILARCSNRVEMSLLNRRTCLHSVAVMVS